MKKNKYYFFITAAALAIICTVEACKKGGTTDNGGTLFGTYDQAAMLTNIGNNIILPSLKNFNADADAETTAINSFISNPDANSLTTAQNAWTKLVQSWAIVAPFDFGPVADNLWYAKIDTWPVNPTKIESAVNAKADASTQGSDAKGLKALEYLLFNNEGNEAVLAKYQASDDRKNYLASVSQDLAKQADNLENAWTGNYANTFSTSQGNDVSSSVSLLINTFSLYLDEIKNMKIGTPIGMGVKINDAQPHPDKIEYTLTEESLPAMIANMQSMKAAFDGGSAQGLDDLLNYVKAKKNNEDLSTVVNNQFDDAINKLKSITPPYSTAVSNQTQQLQAVYNSLKQLIAYFKVDIANNLGVTITFTDTDGD